MPPGSRRGIKINKIKKMQGDNDEGKREDCECPLGVVETGKKKKKTKENRKKTASAP